MGFITETTIWGMCFFDFPSTEQANLRHGNEKSPFLIGDTSSNGWCSIVILVFGGVYRGSSKWDLMQMDDNF